jgi:single-strand DNA-binding protein
MKTISIAGNIGKDAETRTAGDTTVTSWSVAVEDRKGSEKGTMWFDCGLWGARGKALEQYLTKGGKVAVSGDLGQREHNGKTYLTIRVDQVTLLGGKPADRDPAYQAPAKGPAPISGYDDADSIPF